MKQGAHRGKPAVSGRLACALAALTVGCVATVVVTLSPGADPSQAATRAPSVTSATSATDSTGPTETDGTADAGDSSDAAAGTAEPARNAGPLAERPTSATLPSGKVVPIRPVSTTPGGTLDVPGDIDVSGWWRGGSRLGDPFGSTLLAAHVDSSTQGLGPYAELLSVRSGQTVVLRSAHLEQEFSISSLRLLAKGSLSSAPWIYSSKGARRVVLVTCAGPYLPSKGGYQRLAVVTATPVGEPTVRST